MSGLIKNARSQMSERMSAGVSPTKEMPRKKVTFTMDHAECEPGVFAEDFEITLVSPSPEDEIEAGKTSQGSAIAYGFALAKRSLYAVNGEQLDHAMEEHNFLWNVLSMNGRQIVIDNFTSFTTTTNDAAKKAATTRRIH